MTEPGKVYNGRTYIRRSLVERFMAKVDRGGDDACWEWQGSRVPAGYGQISADHTGRLIPAHRASWLIHRGPIPDGLWVLHRCDNRPCVNPVHLFLGTPKDNIDDMDRKGRRRNAQPTGNDHWSHRRPERVMRGEAHHQAKVTAAQVEEIRRRYSLGDVLQRELAAEYGISQVQVSKIVRRVSYV